MRSSLLTALFLTLGIATPRSARAFDDPAQFFPQPMTPHTATLQASAEGLYFTGAPRFSGLTCAKCHIDAPGKVDLKLGADPDDLFTVGYQPGKTYELEVELLHETEGLEYPGPTCTEPPGRGQKFSYVQCNNNAFALEADTDSGPMTGANVFCAAQPQNGACPAPDPANDQAEIAPGNDAVFANRPHSTQSGQAQVVTRNDPTSWHFYWTAPQAGSGPVTFYIAAVDGNGGTGAADNDQDPYGDDTVDAQIFIREAGSPPPIDATAGCGLAPGAPRTSGAGGVLLLFALLGLYALVERLRRTTP